MTYAELHAQAKARNLAILGGFHPDSGDQVPAGCKTLLLLGPNEPGFWPAFISGPEWQSGVADPMDKWSSRVIGDWASDLGAQALYPFGGAPYLPFSSWATKTGRIHTSPIMLLVHDQAGLLVSFRGALSLPQHITLPKAPPNPCNSCIEKPCRTTCPVAAFDGKTYDVPACKKYLGTRDGTNCMSFGCGARLACPVSQSYPRRTEQSAYHMAMFKG